MIFCPPETIVIDCKNISGHKLMATKKIAAGIDKITIVRLLIGRLSGKTKEKKTTKRVVISGAT